ncbi:hypothetical protein TNCT_625821 [Trichonephila clavata]|uniref:Uncharacterized protein n=1 Tax=Trichonephila clavata TaxID=2740835 RepID=A0A8X6FFK7_TRICU|nr:hypothetical protein TNCT_625821 [Trichonephila clavata]
MIAWIFCFLKNAKKTDVCETSEVRFSEFDHAEKTVIKLIQKETFERERDEKLSPLKPFLNEFGILRGVNLDHGQTSTENIQPRTIEAEINLPKEQSNSVIRTSKGRKASSPKCLTYAQSVFYKNNVRLRDEWVAVTIGIEKLS